MTSRAIHEIQSDMMRLLDVKLKQAIEAENWVGVGRLADQLKELASNGIYHSQKAKIQEIGRFAMNGYSEREPR